MRVIAQAMITQNVSTYDVELQRLGGLEGTLEKKIKKLQHLNGEGDLAG